MFRMVGKWIPLTLLMAGMAACDESPVTLGQPTSIAAATAEIRLTVGDVTSLNNQVLDQNGQPIRGLQASFVSDNPSIVAVDADGNVRAVSPGTANITASYGGVTSTTRVTVARDERAFVRTLDVLADSLVTDVSAGVQRVLFRAFNGFGQSVCPQVTFQVSDRTVASVTQDGCRLNVTPLFPGRTTINVAADGVSDNFTVVVSSITAAFNVTARPAGNQLFAGNTVQYSVRLVDETGTPLANRTVNFDVTAGRLSATSVTTNANGVATVGYTLPTDLRTQGSVQSIIFRAPLPNGGTAFGSETVQVTAAAPASITLYQGTSFFNAFTPITGTSVSTRVFNEILLGARGEDQFGNPVTDFTFTLTGPGQRTCNDSRSIDGTEFNCVRSNTTGTSTFTASAGGVSRSVQVTFTP